MGNEKPYKQSKLELNSKGKAEVENEDEYFSNKIEIPKSSYPNSNDISKINSSLFSPVESEENKKNLSIQFEKCKIIDNMHSEQCISINKKVGVYYGKYFFNKKEF